jgi:PAS domain S-box-containing protein
VIQYGYTVEEVLGQSFTRFIFPDDLEKTIAETKKVFKTGIGTPYNFRIRKKDGGMVWVEEVSSVLVEKGQATQIVGTIRDVTERKKAEQLIRESEEKYRGLTEGATDQIFMVDKGHRYLSANLALAVSLRTPIDKILGKRVSDLYPKATAGKFIGNLDSVFKTGLPKTNIEESIEVAESKLDISTSLNPIKDPQGNVVAVAGIVRDVTESKKTQKALLESEAKNRTLVESLPACIKMFDDTGHLVSINAYGQAEHGLQKMSIEEIRKWDFLESIEKEDQEKVKKALADALEGKTSSFVIRHTHTHAKGGFCFSTVVPILNGGKIKNVLFTSLDVTEQQNMQDALRESEERYRDIVENSTEMIHSVDSDNRIRFANRRESELLGYSPKELIGMPLSKIYSKDLFQEVEHGFKRLKQEGSLYIPRSQLIKKNGEPIDVEIHSIAIYDAKGQFVRTRSILIDITQRLKTEEELNKKVEQMEFMGRTNLKRYRRMLEMESEIELLKKKLARKESKMPESPSANPHQATEPNLSKA